MASDQQSQQSTVNSQNTGNEEQGNTASQDYQPESGSVREGEEIRQSSPASQRANEKQMESPEES